MVASDNEAYGDLAKAFRADIDSGKAKARELDARLSTDGDGAKKLRNGSCRTMEVVVGQLHDIAQRIDEI